MGQQTNTHKQVEQMNTDKNNAAALYQRTLEEHKTKLAAAQEEGGKEKSMGNVFEGVKSLMSLKGLIVGTSPPVPR